MTEHIFFINGVACPHDTKVVTREQNWANECVDKLNTAKIGVTVIGDRENGFCLADLTRAFEAQPTTNVIYIFAHGNIEDDRHYMAIGKNHKSDPQHKLWADDFYKHAAKASGGQPLNIFINSCGSGNGCEAFIKNMPHGSTMFNLVEPGYLNSYGLDTAAFDVPSFPPSNLAERFLINILCRGFDQNCRYTPQIAVSRPHDDYWDNIYVLWDLVSAERQSLAEPQRLSSMETFFNGHLSKERIAAAIDEVNYRNMGIITYDPAIEPRPKLRGFDKTLEGPSEAIGYFVNRARIGAFQI